MSERIDVKRGTRLDDDEARPALMSGRFALLLARPPAQEQVEAQYRYAGWSQCPCCGHIGWIKGMDSNLYETVICGSCGGAFRG
jgi:hypothetical protein